MQPLHEAGSARRSGFTAAFLSLLFPGLGHIYLGAYRRGLGFAAVPFLVGALAAGFVVRLKPTDLAGLAVQSWFLTAVFVVNLILLGYRAAAILDAWTIARQLGQGRDRRSVAAGTTGTGGTTTPNRAASVPLAALLSIAGLIAVLLVMSVAHIAVARYDLLASGTLDCVFNADAKGCDNGPGGSGGPGDSGDASAPASVGPPVAGQTLPPWNGTDRLNILLIGADEQNGGHNTDTMITVSIDPTTSQVVMFSLPRDTVDVPIPPGPARNVFGASFQGKVNSWFAAVHRRSDLFPGDASKSQPGYNGLKALLGNLYGLNIPYYVEVNFDGFKKVVDALGGVSVNVQVPVVDDDFPSGGGARSRLYIPAGMQHMSGADALKYARSRHTSSDFDRGARQQRVLVSLRQQTDISRILPSLDALTTALRTSVRTDVPRELVPQLLSLAEKSDTRSIRSLIFTPPFYQQEFLSSPRGYIIEPRVDRIRSAVRQAFTVDPTAAQQRDALAEEGAEVWVLNGSQVNGQAATLAAYLDYLGIAATAPTQKPDTTGLTTTTIRAYNGAETTFPLTTQMLQTVFGVQVVPLTDPAVKVDFAVITAKTTPTLTPPPVP